MRYVVSSLVAIMLLFTSGLAFAQADAPVAVASVTATDQPAPAAVTPAPPVQKPNPWHLNLRGVYGSDDEVTLPQIASTSYHRNHAAMNRSARDYPTLDYYRPTPNTPSCPLYTQIGQDEVTLPQYRGDCIR